MKNKAILSILVLILSNVSLSTEQTETSNSASNPVVTIGAVGDVYLGGRAEEFIKKEGADYPFLQVQSILDESDLLIGNLESPLTDANKTYTKKQYHLKAPPSFVNSLIYSGINIVSIANNHIMDYGKKGLEDTLEALKKYNIGITGAGLSLEDACEPYDIEIKGIKFAFVAFGAIQPKEFYATSERAGIVPADEKTVINTIKYAKQQADVVVASFHWGKEKSSQPTHSQIHLAHTAINAGANLVLGHHPHVVQGVEYYKQGVIAYSLGNFVFGSYSKEVKESMILLIDFTKEGEEVKISKVKTIPILVDNNSVFFQPTLLKDADAQKTLGKFAELAKARGTQLEIDSMCGIFSPMPLKQRVKAITETYQKSTINGTKPTEQPQGVTISPRRGGKYHIVKKGETVEKIAKKYKMTVKELKKKNNLTTDLIRIKQVLLIRPSQKFTVKPAPLPLTNPESEEFNEYTQSIIEASMEYLGMKYKFGGNGRGAIDCSALVKEAFKSMNLAMPRTAKDQFEIGEVVDELKPGDLVFFATRAPYATHVGIYLGDNEFIHASKENGVGVSSIYHQYYVNRFLGAKRIVGSETAAGGEIKTSTTPSVETQAIPVPK